MATQIIYTYGIEYRVNQGTSISEPTENLNLVHRVNEPTEYQWDDAICGLVDGPTQLTGFTVAGLVFLDTRTIVVSDPDPQGEGGGELISDTVVRTYPPYTLNSFTVQTDAQGDWVDASNPVKPRQYEGPIVYTINSDETGNTPETGIPMPMAGGGVARGGIVETPAIFNGFVLNVGQLPDTPPIDGFGCFLVDLETGRGYIWADSAPGAGQGPRWTNTGVAKSPDLIGTTPLDTIDDLPLGEDAPEVGFLQLVNSGNNYGNMYEYTTAGWINVGPIQSGNLPFVVIDPDIKKSYISGYIYSLVFDQCSLRYVPRLSPGTQQRYTGDVDVVSNGWFPTEPLDRDRNIYPMDSVTHCVPDPRDVVKVTYTVTMVTSLASMTISIYHDVYQPDMDWHSVINGLLANCYFTNGIYH